MDILENIQDYFILMKNMRKFLIELDIAILKSNISDVHSRKFVKIKIDLDDNLPFEKH